MEAIMTATRNAAHALKMEKELGTVEVGKLADIVAEGKRRMMSMLQIAQKIQAMERGEPLADLRVSDLPDQLRSGDVLVVNDTRVIPARLSGVRVRGEAVARIDVTLHKREGEDRWRAFVRPAKKLRVGERIRFGETSESMACLLASLDAEVVEKGEEGEVLLAFSFVAAASRSKPNSALVP